MTVVRAQTRVSALAGTTRAAWLDAEWAKMDRWVDATLAAEMRVEAVAATGEIATASAD